MYQYNSAYESESSGYNSDGENIKRISKTQLFNINKITPIKISMAKYSKFTVPKENKTYKQICYPKEYNLQPQQKFLAEYINPKTNNKSVLVFHKIGSGKTCAAIRIAEVWKNKRKIIAVMPASMLEAFRTELRSQCANYLSEEERKLLDSLHPRSREVQQILKESNKKIDKYYEIYSFNKFVSLLEGNKINFRNKLLIIDEIQNMVSEQGKYYEVLHDSLQRAPADLRIVIMSATPIFDKPIEIALTFNLLRIPMQFPIGIEFEKVFVNKIKTKGDKYIFEAKNLDVFKNMIKGYVSYYSGAPPIAFPEERVKFVKCEMNDFQYRTYLTVMRKEYDANKLKEVKNKIFTYGTVKDLQNNFFFGSRVVSNIAFPNQNIGMKGVRSFRGKALTTDLYKYSTKFVKILQKIKHSPGPVFVYSNFKEEGGLLSFTHVLDANGYSDYVVDGEGTNRYALWTSDESPKAKEALRTIFNSPDNMKGKRIKIIVGSPSIKEGVSLFNVRQVHILDIAWNWSRMMQIIGRGSRYCSHKLLPLEKRFVNIYIYIATHPKEKETIDQYMYKLSVRKQHLINQFTKAMKESAIDCKLFYNANKKWENNFKCDA